MFVGHDVWVASAAVTCLYFDYRKNNITYDRMELQTNHVLLGNESVVALWLEIFTACHAAAMHFLHFVIFY